MAFLILAAANPDVALIEVGLGGRYDSTNVLNPLVAVITRLALDHTDRLGPDLTSIAAEKAGIIKPGRPLVVAPQPAQALSILLSEAERQNAPVRMVGRDLTCELLSVDPGGTHCTLRGIREYGQVRVNLLGAHQSINAATAVATAETLVMEGFSIPPDAVRRGLDTAVWPGRLEIVRREPLVILDGAHNPDGMLALSRALREVFQRDKVDFLLGILDNRPVEEMVGLIAPLARRVVVTIVPGGTSPGATTDRLQAAFAGHHVTIEAEADPECALGKAITGLPPGGLLCVCGSLYLVGKIRSLF